jgi:drug/metabolite transporter (DMT)-like permease
MKTSIKIPIFLLLTGAFLWAVKGIVGTQPSLMPIVMLASVGAITVVTVLGMMVAIWPENRAVNVVFWVWMFGLAIFHLRDWWS